jgi:DNA primase
MARIKDASVEQVKAAADIVDVVSGRAQLKKQGPRLVGRCPFHEERTPSFTVDPVKKVYHCFGCRAGGDVIRFVERTQQVSFPEAVRRLARRAGLAIDDAGSDHR